MSSIRKIGVVLMALCMSLALAAQELNCTVTVNSDQIEGSNKQVFKTLQQSVSEMLNTTKWTGMSFGQQERIECSMMIIVKSVADNVYNCEMQLQSRRPVFATAYSTPVLNYKDNYFTFTYQEYDRLEFQPSSFSGNLASMLAYYAYLIIGMDCDTYARLGGTQYFQMCESIVNMAQSSSEGDEQTGWKAFGSNRNRYTLSSNLMDEAFKPMRGYVYDYHRQGLDVMQTNVANGRARIAEGIGVLKTARNARPNSVLTAVFLDAKADELVNIFAGGLAGEKKQVYTLLTDIDPTRSNTYDAINNK